MLQMLEGQAMCAESVGYTSKSECQEWLCEYAMELCVMGKNPRENRKRRELGVAE